MGKTYRKGTYTKGKKVLEGSGGIVKQKSKADKQTSILYPGRSLGYDDYNIKGKKHKFRKGKAKMESSMKELQDNIDYFGYIIYM